MRIEDRVQHCSHCNDDRQLGERVLVGYWTLSRGATSCTLVETWAIAAKVETYRSRSRRSRNHVSRFTIDGAPFRPDCLLWGCICEDRAAKPMQQPQNKKAEQLKLFA